MKQPQLFISNLKFECESKSSKESDHLCNKSEVSELNVELIVEGILVLAICLFEYII